MCASVSGSSISALQGSSRKQASPAIVGGDEGNAGLGSGLLRAQCRPAAGHGDACSRAGAMERQAVCSESRSAPVVTAQELKMTTWACPALRRWYGRRRATGRRGSPFRCS